MSTYAITGANRGIGLEMVRQLLTRPATKVKFVVAITRAQDDKDLGELVAQSDGRARNVVIPDFTSQDTVKAAVPKLEEALPDGLDVLINNAGTSDGQHPDIPSMTTQELVDVFTTNVGSVHAITSGLLPLLEKGQRKTVLNISTGVGSIGRARNLMHMKNYAYKVSKAALNMLMTQYAILYGEEGFTIFAVSPGWLQTRLGSEKADLSVETGVGAVLAILDKADHSYNGKFMNIDVPGIKNAAGVEKYQGEEIPW